MEVRDRFGHVHLQPIVVVGDGLCALQVCRAEGFAGFNELDGEINMMLLSANMGRGAHNCVY